MKRVPGALLRALARLLVRGPDAPYLLGDLEEAMQRDVARGVSLHRARLRFLMNVLGSSFSFARSRVPRRAATAGTSEFRKRVR